MITLAFDTATDVATVAVVDGRGLLVERRSRAVRVLREVESALEEAGLAREEVQRIVAGTGPGSYTGLRMGLVTARALAFALDVPALGVSTLAALAAGAPGAMPVVDARRGQVFTLAASEPLVLAPEDLAVAAGALHVGDGAVRYRTEIEGRGGIVPPDEDDLHVPWARHHAGLADVPGVAGPLEPLYLRVPDAEVAVREGRLRV